MKGPGLPTLDQVNVFLAVVDAGGFTAARPPAQSRDVRDQLCHRHLELQLGVELFDRETTRRPRLTEADTPCSPGRGPSPRRWMSCAPA